MRLEDATDADLFNQGLVSLWDFDTNGSVMDPFPVCHSLTMVALKMDPEHEWVENIDHEEGSYRICSRCGWIRSMKFNLQRLT